MQTTEREALALLGFFYLQTARSDRAATVFSTLDIVAPDDTKTLLSLALAHVRAGHPDLALAALDRLALLGELDAWAHLLRSQALSMLGRVEPTRAAMRAYLSARAAVPENKLQAL
jgi:Flp pilus assembly protein TadD